MKLSKGKERTHETDSDKKHSFFLYRVRNSSKCSADE